MSIITNLPNDMSYSTGESGYLALQSYGLFGKSYTAGPETPFFITYCIATNPEVKAFILEGAGLSEYSTLFNVPSTVEKKLYCALILVADNTFSDKQFGYDENANMYEYYSNNSIVKEIGGNSYNIIGTHARGDSGHYTISSYYTGIYNVTGYTSILDGIIDSGVRPISTGYPIAYNATNCTMSGPTEASGGTEVVVNVTPSSGYILRSSGVSVIDSTGVTVPHIVQGNQIAFTMPYAP